MGITRDEIIQELSRVDGGIPVNTKLNFNMTPMVSYWYLSMILTCAHNFNQGVTQALGWVEEREHYSNTGAKINILSQQIQNSF